MPLSDVYSMGVLLLYYLGANENNIDMSKFKNNTFILFEYTTNWPETIQLLNKNNIKYSIHTDDLDLNYIII